ncbi:head decoration protein [Limnobaculum zhutongyuii]|uniref:Head decoration protein n=1 Tax=Limnobaculum zhutongyuii TaxID=2498113 RepID=A0A411WIQ2_9GAMM|nr:head decoration protein [Limnobaculum zhutongyuii]QBH95768.1 head decoration protein [Limnobaculum zhutongyuii]QBH96050.1 head decoration protein [Limnobaculum zhutongyuii]TQS86167.1 head decoration protein [Limnobaculum zhutongyuii]
MTTYNEPKVLSDVLLVEVKPGWTKDRGMIVADKKYELGTVLAKVSGKYYAIDLAGTGAAKKAAAVLAQHIDTTTGERLGAVIARGAVVAIDGLVWPEGVTDAQKTTAYTELEALGIIAREQL